MHTYFASTLSQLRREKGVSQRQASQELGVSQALLSHYENGIREPGLAFVVKVCDYYRVSADYLLGRSPCRDVESAAGDHLLKTADTMSRVCVDLCRNDPELDIVLRRMASQMNKELELKR